LARYARDALRAHLDISAHLAATRPDVVVVNTLTIPPWLTAARQRSVPTVCHVHEAEETAGRPVRTALALPTALASVVVVNSRASLAALVDVVPALRARARVVYNGVAGPAPDGDAPRPGMEGAEGLEGAEGKDVPLGATTRPSRLVVVGRLSPRKGTDVALEAVALLVTRGYDVQLDVCGSAFSGYEWFEEQLRARASRPDLAGRVTFHGYVNPTWPYLLRARVVLVPSRQEPFGNTAVEAMLARRPVVASDVQGLREIVDDGVDGVLVPAGDAVALADAVARLLDDPAHAGRLAAAAAGTAAVRFSPERYGHDIGEAVEAAARVRRHR
ncbi:MAG: glycosyltransferase, partial [Lapillicoccus sp.]